MRSLKSKSTFKIPFSQEGSVKKSSPSLYPKSRSKQTCQTELSPLHLGGRIQTVTPKTKKQILKRLAYDMKRQASSAVSSPSISFPFDSQPDHPKTTDDTSTQHVAEGINTAFPGVMSPGVALSPVVTSPGINDISAVSSPGLSFPYGSQSETKVKDISVTCETNCDEETKTCNEIDISGDEFDLKLSQKDEDLAPLECNNKLGISSIIDPTNIESADKQSVPVVDIVGESVKSILELSKITSGSSSTQIRSVDSTLNKEIVQDISISKAKKSPNRPTFYRLKNKPYINPNIGKQNDITQTKKDTAKVANGRKTKISSIQRKKECVKPTPKEDTSCTKQKRKKSVLVCKIPLPLTEMTKPKQPTSSSKSKNRKQSAAQRCKTKMEVKEDVVRVIKKMHREIEKLLRKRTAHYKDGKTDHQSKSCLLTEE